MFSNAKAETIGLLAAFALLGLFLYMVLQNFP
jgi:hypothetical protein